MKLVIDEKLKHRLIGVAVIISLGAIFAPAMMKKSTQNMENNYSVHVKLPAKPTEPKVAVSDEKEVFKTIKITKVHIPEVSSESQLPQLARAEVVHAEDLVENKVDSIKQQTHEVGSEELELAVKQAAQRTPNHVAVLVASTSPKVVKKAIVVAKAPAKSRGTPQVKVAKVSAARPLQARPIVRSAVYAVQLASFSRLANAQALVNKLQSKGYKARYSKIPSQQGFVYKVYAGHSPQKQEVIKLKSQLASALQLRGFIVDTGVS